MSFEVVKQTSNCEWLMDCFIGCVICLRRVLNLTQSKVEEESAQKSNPASSRMVSDLLIQVPSRQGSINVTLDLMMACGSLVHCHTSNFEQINS